MTERKWLVPVVVKRTVWENATATVSAESEIMAWKKAISQDYDDLDYELGEIDAESRVDRVDASRQTEEMT